MKRNVNIHNAVILRDHLEGGESICKGNVSFGLAEPGGSRQRYWFLLCGPFGTSVGLSRWPCLPLPSFFFFFLIKNDKIRALETITGCRLALEYLCKPSYNMQNFHPTNLTLDYRVPYSCLIFYLCTQSFLHLEPIYWHVYLYIFQQGIFSALFWRICGVFLFYQRDIVKSRLEKEKENCLRCPSFLIHIMILFLYDLYDISMWNSKEFNFSWVLRLSSNNHF